eukprot:386260_1
MSTVFSTVWSLRGNKHLYSIFYNSICHYRSNLLPSHTKIKMPEIGDNHIGEIVKWHKKIGDKLQIDDAICEIDMDQLTLDLEAEVDGYLCEIVIPEGIKVKSGTTVARQVETEKDLEIFTDALTNSRDTAERDLIFAYRILADLGYDNYINLNHISVSIPSSYETPWNKIIITAKDGFCWHNITKKDLKEINIEHTLKQQKSINNIDAIDIYCTLIQKTPTINTLFHIMSDSFLTFSCINPNELLMINPLCARFLNRVMYVNALEEIYDGSFITFANVIVVKNYGVLITGSSIEQAFDTWFYFEQMIKLQLEIVKLTNGNSDIKVEQMDNEKVHQLQIKYQENAYNIAKKHFDARKRSVLEKQEELLEEMQE